MFFRIAELPGYDIEDYVRESEIIMHEYDYPRIRVRRKRTTSF